MEVAVDVGDQAGAWREQEHGADAAGGEPVRGDGQFVVDVGGGDHAGVAFGTGCVLEASEDSVLALPGLA